MRILVAIFCLSACAATVGTTGLVNVPKDAATTCASHCAEMGLKLSSVVVMANNVGCVCSPAATAKRDDAGAASAGMATLLLQEEQQRQQQVR